MRQTGDFHRKLCETIPSCLPRLVSCAIGEAIRQLHDPQLVLCFRLPQEQRCGAFTGHKTGPSVRRQPAAIRIRIDRNRIEFGRANDQDMFDQPVGQPDFRDMDRAHPRGIVAYQRVTGAFDAEDGCDVARGGIENGFREHIRAGEPLAALDYSFEKPSRRHDHARVEGCDDTESVPANGRIGCQRLLGGGQHKQSDRAGPPNTRLVLKRRQRFPGPVHAKNDMFTARGI